MTALLVAVGGATGALARYGIGTLVSTDRLPWATVAINVTGSFLLGLLIATGGWFSEEARTGLAVGLLGGFTTFSAFSADLYFEAEAGNGRFVLVYVLVSIGLGVAAAGAGVVLGRRFA